MVPDVKNSPSLVRSYNVDVFCPVCEAEFVEGVTRCPDDEVDLVDHPPPISPHHRRDDPPPARDPVVVRKLLGQPELGEPMAEFIRNALKENHIDVWVSGEFSTPGPYGRVLGYPPVEILVSRVDAPRAREIIAEVEGSQPAVAAARDDGEESWDGE
jgi:hypothetical protein